MDVGKILGYGVLITIALALVLAGLYAAFGKPSNSSGRKRRQHIIHGFQMGFGIVAGFIVFMMFVVFISVIVFRTETTLASKIPVTRAMAILFGTISFTVMVLTVQNWGKYLGGWMGYSIPAALGTTFAGTFHGRPYSRINGMEYLAIAILTVVSTFRFTEDYELNIGEKIALLTWVVGFALIFNMKPDELRPIAVGTLPLLVAWLYSLWSKRKRKHRRRHATA